MGEEHIYRRIYNNTPSFIKKAINHIYFPYLHAYLSGGAAYTRHVRFFKKSEWWTAERLKAYQFAALKSLLEHAYFYVPYYHSLFKKNRIKPSSFKSLDDLQKLPILSREDVANNFSSLISTRFSLKNKQLVYTSGSTGTPIKFYIDNNCIAANNAFFLRALNIMGAKIEDKHAFFKAAPFLDKKLLGQDFYYDSLNRRLYISPINFSIAKIEKIASRISELEPRYIIGNPTLLYIMSKELKGRLSNFKFLSMYETLTSEKRAAIQGRLKCEIFDWYSVKEYSASALECQAHNGLHIDMERGVFEVLGKDGNHSKHGRVIATGIHNYAMPLIRYDLGDIVSLSAKKCSCGRHSQLISRVDGRSNDFLKLPDDRMISSYIVEDCFDGVDGIFNYKVVQADTRHIRVSIVKSHHFQDNTVRAIKKRMKTILGKSVRLEIETVKQIPCERSGKFRNVVSMLK